MKTLSANNSYKLIIIDDSDFDLVSQYNWNLDQDDYPTIKIKGKTIRIHTMITGLREVDHKDRNVLNNQRNNLRKATRSEQMANTKYPKKASGSQYRGVTFRASRLRWTAQIVKNYHAIHLGTFKSEREAVLAYNKKALELFGEFAQINMLS